MRKILAAVMLVLVIGLVCPMAYGEGPNKTDSDEWQFSITPYLWAIGMNGDMTVKGVDSEVDENFSDILSNLDIALEAHFEVWKGKWGGFFDGTYVKLKTDAGTTGNIDITSTIGLVDFGGFYRVGTWPVGSPEDVGRSLSFDALVGGRYMDLKVKFDPDRLPSFDQNKSWTDLIVGGRMIFDFSEKWAFILRGDIGGFGISGSSDFTANGIGLVGWTFHPSWTLLGGYRALYQDYETGSGSNEFKYDVTTHGPILGLTYAW
ncbi:hypothetical protein N9219_04545 [bacterium]|nr:hypothetical protein [bacterium]